MMECVCHYHHTCCFESAYGDKVDQPWVSYVYESSSLAYTSDGDSIYSHE